MEFAIRIHPTQPHTRGTPAITPACRRSRVESGAEYERSVRDPAIPHRVVEFIGVLDQSALAATVRVALYDLLL